MTGGLRPARETDADALGEILWRFQTDHDWMPDLYDRGEFAGFCRIMIERGWITVAENGDGVCGFLARDGEEICALYVDGTAKSKGVGRDLLRHAKSCSDRLMLRVFQANTGAHRFYGRQGFHEVARGDGADNEENLPDITFCWTKDARP